MREPERWERELQEKLQWRAWVVEAAEAERRRRVSANRLLQLEEEAERDGAFFWIVEFFILVFTLSPVAESAASMGRRSHRFRAEGPRWAGVSGSHEQQHVV